jgi:hypothetical protein
VTAWAHLDGHPYREAAMRDGLATPPAVLYDMVLANPPGSSIAIAIEARRPGLVTVLAVDRL